MTTNIGGRQVDVTINTSDATFFENPDGYSLKEATSSFVDGKLLMTLKLKRIERRTYWEHLAED